MMQISTLMVTFLLLSSGVAKATDVKSSPTVGTKVDEAIADLKKALNKLEAAVAEKTRDGVAKDVQTGVADVLHEVGSSLEKASRNIRSSIEPESTPSAKKGK